MAFNKLKLVSGIVLAVALTACANKEQTVTYIAGNEQTLYAKAVSDLQQNKNTSAEQVLTQLSLQYPFGQYRTQVSVLQAYNDFVRKNYDMSAAQIDKYFQAYPNKANAPYGDYMLLIHALSSFQANRGFFQNLFNMNPADNDTSDIQAGLTDLRTLLDYYPNSAYHAFAQELFNYYADVVAESNYKIAAFYLKYNNPLAAYKRANVVLINFADSYYAKPALEVLYQASTELGLNYQAEYEAIKARLENITPRPLVKKAPTLPSYAPEFLQANQ
ncbi:outer membrane protein assembly factor BamD [Psittacicella gerlachiana]|uniref:Outer membrane lipoprotein BamD-like domain-containing protein n=1 Tax=Psittacicella gerlachiana TaxID=2028574 RepID=A0A3A1YF26_9GAMM|nr:outer membrane protein assembly factor BamD [Psittacicella gerlachiana]RIY35730.1 hypothetical protein CKF59_03310 [Psittacicella gerlachiana]